MQTRSEMGGGRDLSKGEEGVDGGGMGFFLLRRTKVKTNGAGTTNLNETVKKETLVTETPVKNRVWSQL